MAEPVGRDRWAVGIVYEPWFATRGLDSDERVPALNAYGRVKAHPSGKGWCVRLRESQCIARPTCRPICMHSGPRGGVYGNTTRLANWCETESRHRMAQRKTRVPQSREDLRGAAPGFP